MFIVYEFVTIMVMRSFTKNFVHRKYNSRFVFMYFVYIIFHRSLFLGWNLSDVKINSFLEWNLFLF